MGGETLPGEKDVDIIAAVSMPKVFPVSCYMFYRSVLISDFFLCFISHFLFKISTFNFALLAMLLFSLFLDTLL